MYGVDLSVQIENLMPFLGLGFCVGILYDVSGFFRKLAVRLKSVVFVLDFSLCIFVAVISYLLFLGTTDGIVRFYLVLAEITGATVYFLTAGRLISFLFSKTADVILRVLRRIISPFVFISSKISFKGAKLREKTVKKLENFQNKLKKRLKDTV